MFVATLLSGRSGSFEDIEAQRIDRDLDQVTKRLGRLQLSHPKQGNASESVTRSGSISKRFQKVQKSFSDLWHRAQGTIFPRTVTAAALAPQAPTNDVAEEVQINQALFNRIFKQIEKDIRPDPKISKSSPKDPVAYIKRQEQLLLEHPDRAIKMATRTILGHRGAITTVQEQIIGEDTWTDLNLFSGHEASTLVNRINRTSSELGKMYLMGLIGCPTKNVATLRSRQALIQALGAQRDGSVSLADEISELLGSEQVQNGEKQLLSAWDPKLEYPGGISKMFYHMKGLDKLANDSPLALDAGLLYNHGKKMAKLAFQAGSSAVMLYHTAKYCTNSGPSPDLAHLFKQMIGTRGPAFLLASWIPSPLVTVGVSLLASGQTALTMGTDVRWMLVDFEIDGILQKKFFGVASFYRAMKEVYTKLSLRPDITKHLSHFKELKEFFENPKLSNVFSVLESRTFNSEAKWLFRRGNVLYLLDHLMKPEVKEPFEAALKGIAEIDAFVSAAKLANEFKGKRVQFCYPEYVEGSAKPMLHIDNFWNVFVDPDKVVANSIDFSPETPDQCHIITGPNGGGKTTVLRSSVGAVVLGQSLGISAASGLRMTPFTFTASSMDVAGVQGETSHFQAECDRVVALDKRMDALGPNEFGLVVLDELFTGADPEQASYLGRNELERTGARRNVLSMIVTHDKTLPGVAEGNPLFRNFKVVARPDGRPLFRLEEGISDQQFALEEAARRGVQGVDRAREIRDARAGKRE